MICNHAKELSGWSLGYFAVMLHISGGIQDTLRRDRVRGAGAQAKKGAHGGDSPASPAQAADLRCNRNAELSQQHDDHLVIDAETYVETKMSSPSCRGV